MITFTFSYFEDPIVMKNDERAISSYIEENPDFSIGEASQKLSMSPIRIIRTMRRLGLHFEEEFE